LQKNTDISINIVNDLVSNFVALLNASQPTTTKKTHSITYKTVLGFFHLKIKVN
jgi:hypothetical protein